MGQSAEKWVARLDALGSYAAVRKIRRLLDAAPEAAQSTPDYWYARGVVDARAEAEAATI